MRLVGARDRQADRLGAGGQQQLVEVEAAPVSQPDASLARIQGGDRRVEFQADAAPLVETRGLDEDPRLRSLAGEEILGEVRSVDGRLGIGERIVTSPPNPSRRNRSAAAKPAAPPPTMMKRAPSGCSLAAGAASVAFGSFSRTMIRSPECSTRQRGTGSKAGALTASPVRRLKQA